LEGVVHKLPETNSSTRAVFRAICYFDIFNYPLTLDETRTYCSEKISEADLKKSLDELIKCGRVQCYDDYFFLADKSKAIVAKRLAQEQYLASKKKKIRRYAKLISRFPFVEAVFISGSVSKGVLNKEGDVDYFIIATNRRVWLCRTLLVLYKKIFLLGSKKYFCVNYFVDEKNLMVPDKNLFVATEIKTLVPVFENNVVNEFFVANTWASDIFANLTEKRQPLFETRPYGVLKEIVEYICKTSLGEKLDDYFFRKTLDHWRKKFPHFNPGEFDLNMRSYKSVSKHHPQGNQVRVLNELALRMNKLQE
jgi:hypothetical protein